MTLFDLKPKKIKWCRALKRAQFVMIILLVLVFLQPYMFITFQEQSRLDQANLYLTKPDAHQNSYKLSRTLPDASPLNSTKPFSYSTEEVTIEVYLYMIVVETNSDWTTVEFSGGPIVVGYNYTLTRGSEASNLMYTVDPMRIWISKKPYDMTPVSINISIIAIKGDEQGSVTIRKGDIGSTNVSMLAWINGVLMHIWSFTNNGTNPQYPGTNDRSFTLDFKQLYEHPAGIGVFEDVAVGLHEQVLTFYYPWYGVAWGASGQWFHWENATEDSIGNTAHYPLLGIYDSWDERLVEVHILLARHAGIDCFIVSWWGPRSFEDGSLKRIIKVAEKHDFKVTIYYESYRPWNPLISTEDIVNELSYVVREYSGSKAFLKVNGKPVIFIYNAGAHDRGPSFWLQVRRGLEDKVGSVYLLADIRNPSYLHVFDGFHTYVELNSSVARKLYSFYSDRMKIGLAGLSPSEAIEKILAGGKVVIQKKALFYTVIPGYDDRKIRSPGGYVDREDGLLYQRMWNDALELGARHVLITSWNELHEGTEIEPTREHGFKYLEITRDYASKIKQVNIVKPPLPSLNLNINPNELGDKLYLRLFNKGEGSAIAIRIEMIPQPETLASFTDTYRQPGKLKVVIIPLIKSGEEYRIIVKIEKDSGNIKLNLQYYSLNGTFYSADALIFIQKSTSTITKTYIQTTTVTQPTTITTTTTRITTTTDTKTTTVTTTVTRPVMTTTSITQITTRPATTTIAQTIETTTVQIVTPTTVLATQVVTETPWAIVGVMIIMAIIMGLLVGRLIRRR
jgi:glycoprotein endo-alpha-1,2-mannosidase